MVKTSGKKQLTRAERKAIAQFGDDTRAATRPRVGSTPARSLLIVCSVVGVALWGIYLRAWNAGERPGAGGVMDMDLRVTVPFMLVPVLWVGVRFAWKRRTRRGE